MCKCLRKGPKFKHLNFLEVVLCRFKQLERATSDQVELINTTQTLSFMTK